MHHSTITQIIKNTLQFTVVSFFLFGMVASAEAQEVWNSTDWTLYDIVTIDRTNIDDDLTDFPVYVDLADLSPTFWSTTPAGASIVGTDIRVTTDDGTELPRELVAASSTLQTGELHFKAGSISSTTDTVFRIYYNATTTGDYAAAATYGAQNVWSNNFVAVWHLGEGDSTAAGFYKDSTSNSSHLTLTDADGDTASTLGKAGNSLDFNGDADGLVLDVADFTLTDVTISSWIKPGNVDEFKSSFSGSDGGGTDTFQLDYNASGNHQIRHNNYTTTYGAGSIGAWKHVVVTNASSQQFGYLDGIETGSSTNAYNFAFAKYKVAINRGNNNWFTGQIDEVRIASTTRSAAWIAAEHSNQATTTDFYSPTSAITLTTATTTSIATSTATFNGDITFDGGGDITTRGFIYSTSSDFSSGVATTSESTLYDISSSTYDSVAMSVGGQDRDPVDMLFNDDGTYLYVLGYEYDRINRYSLGTSYDIGTAGYAGTALSVGGQETDPRSMLFNDDGTVLYLLGVAGDDINAYTLSTAYDIGSASSDSIALSVSAQDTNPVEMLFNDDGTLLYVLGGAGLDINVYTLSTAYDISSASFDSIALSVSAQETYPVEMLFNNDGTILYVLGYDGDDFNAYTLSTAYDISSATFDSIALSVAAQATVPDDALFNDDGSILYVLDLTNDLVFAYTMAAYATGTYALDVTALEPGETYYVRAFAENSAGTTYITTTESFTTDALLTTLTAATTSDPASFTIAPGSTATVTNTFTLVGTVADTITEITIAHSNASSTSLIEIVSSDGATVYGSTTTAVGTSTTITLDTNISVTTSTTTYKIRMTPKTHANLPSGNRGELIVFNASVLTFDGANTATGTDQSFPLTIDNQSLAGFGIDSASTTFATTTTDYTTGANPYSITAADFNNDGYEDFAVVHTGDTAAQVFLNDGDGTFTLDASYTTGAAPFSITSADFNNDGYVDFAVANYSSSTAQVFLNDGDGTFTLDASYTTGANPDSITTADFNNDGYVDFAVANESSNSVSVFLNDGDGTFTLDASYTTGAAPYFITSADFNNDGYVDFAVVHTGGTDSAQVFLNDGDGTFTLDASYTTGAGPYSITSADFNNDGYVDFAVVHTGGTDSAQVFLNDGDGTFTLDASYVTGAQPYSITSADFNNDGYVDFAGVHTGGTDSAQVFQNQSTSTLTATTTGAGNGEVIISYTTPPDADLNSIVFLASTSAITTAPVDGTTYTGGENIGGATVVCVDTSVATSTADSCTATGLTNGTSYYFAAFTKDTSGNYSFGVVPEGSPVTPVAPPVTTLSAATTSDPASFTIAPGTTATVTNAFALVGEAADTITEITIAHSNASSTSLIEIVSSDGATVYGSTTTAVGTSTTITLDTNISVTTSTTTYKIRMTPKTHANLPSGNRGELIVFNASVLTFDGANTATGTDQSFPLTIDNQSLAGFGITSVHSLAAKVDYTTGTGPESITSADFNNDGYVDLATANYSSSSVSVFLNNGDGTYATKVDYTTGDSPQSVTTADFNNDGYTDLIVASEFTDYVSVFLNNGDGTYASKVDYTTDFSLKSVTAADLNNDGYADLIVVNSNTNTISVFLNNGDGTLAAKIDYTTASNPYSVTAADLNNDGYTDLAVVNRNSSSASVFLNQGDGTYSAKVDYTTGAQPYSITTADLNNDGYVDLATANLVSNSVSVLLNNGDGTYATKVDYTTGTSPIFVTNADFNNDGYTDLTVTNNNSNSISVFLNDGDGTFATKVDYTTGTTPRSVTTADFNDDGFMDLAVANFSSNSVSVFQNQSTSTLTATTTGAGNGEVIISYTTPPDADLNSIVFLASTSAITTAPVDGTTYTGGENIGGATVVCVDTSVATSTADSCTATGLTNGTSYYFAAFTKDTSGNYSFGVVPEGSPVTPVAPPVTTLSAATTSDPASFTIAPGTTATVTNAFALVGEAADTITEITIAHSNASSTSLIEIVSSDGATVYGSTTTAVGTSTTITLDTNISVTTSTTTYKIRMTPKTHANLPSGNRGELIVFNATVLTFDGSNTATGTDQAFPVIIDNQSLASFGIDSASTTFATTTTDYTTGADPFSITTADFNNDGYEDFVMTHEGGTDSAQVFLNDGDGTFTLDASYVTDANPYAITTADFNNDGHVDFAVTNYTGNTAQVFLNDGDGTFTLDASYTTGANPYAITTADFNNDGYVDFAVIHLGDTDSAQVFLNEGDGTFATGVSYATGADPFSITSADFNNDGYIDLAVTNYSANRAQVFLNDGDGTFTLDGTYVTGGAPWSITSADFNNDGSVDFAVVNYTGNSAQVFLNDGDGTFTLDDTYVTGANPRSITTADFNNDGYVDFAVVHTGGTDSAQVFLNDGDGTFTLDASYVTGAQPYSITSADFNNDGYVDFAGVHTGGTDSAQVFQNQSTSTLTATTTGAGNGEVIISYTTPPDADLDSIVFLASTSAITTAPVDGTTYTGGENIGGATVACVDASVATSTADSCISTGLTGGTSYYFAAFAKDTSGNYSAGVEPEGSPVTPTAAPVWNATDWTLYDTLTIKHEAVDEPLADFPVYVDLADLSANFWSTITDGGGDIRVTTADGTPVELAREVVSASTTLETGELHFKADYISEVIDTSFRIYYNGTTTNDYATNATYGAENVWEGTYMAVYHNGGGTDSTSFNRTAASTNTVTPVEGGVTGKVGVGSDLINGTDNGFATATSTDINGLSAFTVSMWYKSDGAGGDRGIYSLESVGNYSSFDSYTKARFDSVGLSGGGTNVLKLGVGNEADEYQAIETSTNDASANWTLLHHRWESGSTQRAALNGVLTTNTFEQAVISGTLQADVLTIGAGGNNSWYFNGIMDEFRVASTSLSDAWIAAEHINQSTTTDFYFLGAGTSGTGSSTLSDHDATQVNNTFSFQNDTDGELFAFKLTPQSGTATIAEVTLELHGAQKVYTSDFSNITLYRDHNNDATYDAGDEQIATGVMTLGNEGHRSNNQQGTIVFSTDFLSTTTMNYLVTANWNAPENGSQLTIDLKTSGIIATDSNGGHTIFGDVDHVQHSRNNKGGGGSSAAVGTPAPAGDGVVSGGGAGGGGVIDTNTGGALIGNSPDFKAPTTNTGAWTNPANAYDNTDGTYATDAAGGAVNYNSHGFAVAGSNTIQGVEVKLESSGTTAAGTIDVQLSWDGGTTWTSVKTTPTLTTTDVVVSLGGPSDLWGRIWTASEFTDGNFSVRLTGSPSTNTIQLDEIRVKVYHQTSGGGGGGGGAI